MAKRVGKRGDTLIEVMLAVGIFSMVAVAVVAVMSGGTSGAQTALETTLTREEIDAQAEALRFIQSSYIAEKDDKNGAFSQLWQTITDSSHTITDTNGINSVTSYSVDSCEDLYSSNVSNIFSQKAFVIDTRALGDLTKANSEAEISAAIGKTYISTVPDTGEEAKMFKQASTYPRLVYSDDAANLIESGASQTLQGVEGIYVVAVKDPNSTHITEKGKTSAYYDFYIRTCWYGTGDKTPSTISTVMRLYDPGIVEVK